MKKILTLIVALVATATVAHAQFGIVGGLNFSNAKFENAKQFGEAAKNATLWHAGVAWKMSLPLGFAIQPELTYQVKGVKIEDVGSATAKDFKFNNGYIELGAGVQWGPDLIIARPYVTAVYGGREEGVIVYTEKIGAELVDTMKMCGASSLDVLSEKFLFRPSNPFLA